MRYPALRRPPAVDFLIASGLLVASLVEIWVAHVATGPPVMGSLVAVLSTVPLVWRRSVPWLAVAGACLAALAPCLASPPVETGGLTVMIAWMFAVHAVNAYRPAREAALGTGLFLVAVSTGVLVTAAVPSLINVVWGWAIFGAAAAAGQVMAHQRRRHDADRVIADARSRDAERRLVARELHDIVAHGVAVMVVQAGAAQQLIAVDPAKATEMLEAVQRTGEQSATELRRMLSLLSDETPSTEPQPGLADLDTLIEQVQAAGLRVHVHSDTRDRPMPPALQVTVYRIVQEGLTNVLKHAPGSDTQVNIRQNIDELTIDIINTLKGNELNPRSPTTPSAPGRGLTGMRERVHLYGGQIDAGPVDIGWRISAVLPTPVTPTTPAESAPTSSVQQR